MDLLKRPLPFPFLIALFLALLFVSSIHAKPSSQDETLPLLQGEEAKPSTEENPGLTLSAPHKDLVRNLENGDLRFIGYVIDKPETPGADGKLIKEFGVWYIDAIQMQDENREILRMKIAKYCETYNRLLSERLHQEFDNPEASAE